MVARDVLWLGRFRKLSEAGRGVSSRVFHLVDVATGRHRALKVVVDAAHEAALLDEFTQLAHIEHPSLPRVFEVGRTTERLDDIPAGAPYFIADWITGIASRDAPPTGDTNVLWNLLADIAGALAAIHAAGLIHADVAPQNILVANDRAVLVDLGLAGASPHARGTPVYMAPEALAGALEPRSDLYSLAASVVRLATGQPPFAAANLGELAAQIVGGRSPALPTIAAPLADLIRRMMAVDPTARPPSAIAVLDELDQLAPAVGLHHPRRARPPHPPTPRLRWRGAREFVDRLVALLDDPAPVVVVGSPASGARQLVDDAIARRQLQAVARHQPTAPLIAGALDEVAVRVGAETATTPQAWLVGVARAIANTASHVVIELADDPRAPHLVSALASAPANHPTVVIVESPLRGEQRAISAPLLDDDGVGSLIADATGKLPTREVARTVLAATGGLPLAVIELARASGGESIHDTRGDYLTAVRERALAASTPSAQRIAAAVAVWGRRASRTRALATARLGSALTIGLGDVLELERRGLLRRGAGGELFEIDQATADAIGRVVGDRGMRELATAALDSELIDQPPVGELAGLFEIADFDRDPQHRGRVSAACQVAEQLLTRGRPDRALAIANRVSAIDAGAALIAARSASALGRYGEVARHLDSALASGADPVAAELIGARAAQRSGALDDAEQRLAKCHAARPTDREVAGAYARLLVTRSRYADAARIARMVTPLSGLAAEAAGLAAFYLGELESADSAFAALELSAAASDDPAAIGRALSLRGMVAQQRGQLALATDRYREAARRLNEVGEHHASATAELNLGTVLAERGRHSEALARLTASARVFSEFAVDTELCAAEFNRANSLAVLGELAEARTVADAACARATGAPHLLAFALIVAGEARRRSGDHHHAIATLRRALALAEERSDIHAQISAHVALAEAGEPATVDVERLCASSDDRDRWTLAEARRDLATGSDRIPSERARRRAAACREVAERAAADDRVERAFRAHALAAQLWLYAGDPATAQRHAESARAAHGAMVATTAPAFRAALERDSDLLAIAGGPLAVPSAPRATLPAPAPPLRRLLTLSRRLNSEASVERILDEVIDTAIELTSAERGFLLLRDAANQLAPVVARNFALGDLREVDDLANLATTAPPANGRPAAISRSIAERAAQTGEPIITIDAGIDERFGSAASVAALRLRSVLVVPLRQRGTIIGCIYVDHRLRGGAFDDDAATVLGELADIAAIAIDNARLNADLRKTTHEVAALNERLSAELADRDAELVRVRAELPDRDRLRHRYERIVGRSPATVRMLELVDRAAATTLPTVIVGESGTGKELVARALHDHGARGDGPFVAINCSAVPEPLLESELFGHIRGSFTGADRDRRGLFEVADGGTLFLDEIADTSAAMQSKLLRVLQDGLVRRVGDTKTRKVDVRVVAASQRPLGELVAAGRFRDDLRFRIDVITIPIPPLRDREGDLPLLVEALLGRLCGDRTPPRLTRAAARALAAHRWPGNVRELENALARGLAMGSDTIDVEDLPEAIAALSGRPEPLRAPIGNDLRLKPALATTEQAYIAAAMTRAKGNQTVAAKLLGLSRFGLQKKLRRIADGDDHDPDDD